MASLTELQAMRDELVKVRSSGRLSVSYEGKKVEYKADAQMKSALDALEAEIAKASGTARASQIRISTSKGF